MLVSLTQELVPRTASDETVTVQVEDCSFQYWPVPVSWTRRNTDVRPEASRPAPSGRSAAVPDKAERAA